MIMFELREIEEDYRRCIRWSADLKAVTLANSAPKRKSPGMATSSAVATMMVFTEISLPYSFESIVFP